jgi:hypothetical protein
MTDDPRKERILAAAEAFVAVMHVPEDGNRKLAEWRREQQAAYERLVAAVEQDVVRHVAFLRSAGVSMNEAAEAIGLD